MTEPNEQEPKREARHVACPSCRAEIEVNPDGTPVAHEVAHFDIHKGLIERVERVEQARNVPPAQPAKPPAKRARWATLQFGGDDGAENGGSSTTGTTGG